MQFAAVRPDSWNILLFIHVAGAMALVALLLLAGHSIRHAAQRGDQPTTRFAFRSLWMGVLPSYIVMRVGAQLILSKEKLEDSDDAWIGVGFAVSDVGLLLLIILIVVTGLAARKAKQGTSVAGSTGLKVANALAALLVLAYVVAIWAMTTKPT